MKQKDPTIHINYLYFGFVLLFLIILTTIKVFIISSHTGSRIFFLFYSLAQCVIEVAALIFFGWLIKKSFSRKAYFAYIGLSFLLILTHPIDFVVNRILDLSFWDTMDFVLDENVSNFIEMLHASGLPMYAWVLIFIALGTIPLLGVFAYKMTEKFTNKRPLGVLETNFVQTLFCIPLAMALWDFAASKVIHPDAYHAYPQALPWKFTFLQPKYIYINHPKSPMTPPNETATIDRIEKAELVASHKPNVYLFIIESLREDFITADVAPNMYRFKNENIAFEHSFSNANATQISWFSLFHSNFPHFWAHVRKSNWEGGSMPIKLMKKMGYQAHVYSSAMLGYYDMEKLIFGKDHHLADHYKTFPHYYPTETWESDLKAVRELERDLKHENVSEDGNLCVIFLDSTHFDYSWPKRRPAKFSPVCDEIGYFKINPSEESVNPIKNRYRNAIHYVDLLFGHFVKTLKEQGLYEESVIIVLGDHGEEFYEQGNIFHCSHLSHQQTSIPLYFKFGKNEREVPSKKLCSQMEIFPSVLDYITDGKCPSNLLEGSSIFDPNRWPFTFTARYNASRPPYEFFIHNGERKVTARFMNRKNIFSSKRIQILSLHDCPDTPTGDTYFERKPLIKKQFGAAFERIFSKNSK